jgi:predicted helicase
MTKTKDQIFHADLWGVRKQKYHALLEADLKSVPWKALEPAKPFYLFIPQSDEMREEYEQGWKVTEIFPVNVLGFQTHRDEFAISYDKDSIKRRIRDMLDKTLSDATLYEKYHIKDNRDWKLASVRIALQSKNGCQQDVIQCAYRPFDNRWCYFGHEFMDYPRRQIIDHIFKRNNLSLLCSRQICASDWQHVNVSDAVPESCLISDKTKEQNYVFPLYLYPPPEGHKKPKPGLLIEDDPFEGKERIENFAPAFRKEIDAQYGKQYSPEEILGYIYAVLYSPTYRAKYLEFLKIDFPRIPFVEDRETFEILSELGQELVQAHLLRMIPTEPKVNVTKGGFEVEKPAYDEKHQRLYINKEQYFSPVSEEVWEFQIGGYQVLDKYLKSRKGRTLSLDEIENIQNVVKSLAFTIQQMQKIDDVWQPSTAVLETVA